MLTHEQEAWLLKQLWRNGYQLAGSVSLIQQRAWSQVMTVPTTNGVVYLKMVSPVLRFEAGLTMALYRWRMPVPEVVAVEPGQGWLLLADAGQPLRQLLQTDRDIGRWQTAVSHYAQMQIALIPRAATLLELGVFDRRLERLPTLFAALLQDTPAMLLGHEEGLTAAEYSQLHQAIPQFTALCQRLAAFGIPETLHHDDFHDNNVFVKNGRYTFADWGETCLAHPFFSLIIVLRNAAYILKLEAHDPALARVRDAYLAQWRALGTLAELQKAFALAQTVGTVNRALTWHALLVLMSEAERAEEAPSVPGWLQLFLPQTSYSQKNESATDAHR